MATPAAKTREYDPAARGSGQATDYQYAPLTIAWDRRRNPRRGFPAARSGLQQTGGDRIRGCAGREKRIYAVPPYTPVESLDFDDHPFTVQEWDEPCAICGSRHSYLDEVVLDDSGKRMFVCSDTDYCRQQSEEQKK